MQQELNGLTTQQDWTLSDLLRAGQVQEKQVVPIIACLRAEGIDTVEDLVGLPGKCRELLVEKLVRTVQLPIGDVARLERIDRAELERLRQRVEREQTVVELQQLVAEQADTIVALNVRIEELSGDGAVGEPAPPEEEDQDDPQRFQAGPSRRPRRPRSRSRSALRTTGRPRSRSRSALRTTGEGRGHFKRDHGTHGFIRTDGSPDMLVLPKSLPGRKFPSPGTFMAFDVVTDARTARPRAEKVRYD